ncbi:hypothetical protein GCM10023317_67520 [Actinopolymorpha pittospori]
MTAIRPACSALIAAVGREPFGIAFGATVTGDSGVRDAAVGRAASGVAVGRDLSEEEVGRDVSDDEVATVEAPRPPLSAARATLVPPARSAVIAPAVRRSRVFGMINLSSNGS